MTDAASTGFILKKDTPSGVSGLFRPPGWASTGTLGALRLEPQAASPIGASGSGISLNHHATRAHGCQPFPFLKTNDRKSLSGSPLRKVLSWISQSGPSIMPPQASASAHTGWQAGATKASLGPMGRFMVTRAPFRFSVKLSAGTHFVMRNFPLLRQFSMTKEITSYQTLMPPDAQGEIFPLIRPRNLWYRTPVDSGRFMVNQL